MDNKALAPMRRFMMTNAMRRLALFFSVFGPATITAMADNDASGVATYSIAGSKLGYPILFLLLIITILLGITQEMGMRLALITRRGLADLIRERYGVKAAFFIFAALAIANTGTVIGDMAAHRDLNGNQLPGLAPVAMQQGAYVGRLIGRHLRGETGQPFHYVDKGTLATIGRNRAVARFRKLRFSGFVAWIVWLFVHLLYLVGFQNRVLVVIQWAFHYFTYNRKARLIVATGPTISARVNRTRG